MTLNITIIKALQVDDVIRYIDGDIRQARLIEKKGKYLRFEIIDGDDAGVCWAANQYDINNLRMGEYVGTYVEQPLWKRILTLGYCGQYRIEPVQ